MSVQTESPSEASIDLLTLRSEIETGLLDKALAALEPKINEMLYRNIFDAKEAAKYLKISSATLHRLLRDREIPYFKLRGSLLFRQWELDDFISKRMIRKGDG
ncbi:helix-turn-helix domain-containing protein [Paenibacillus sp. strain BS8-2]